MTLRTALLASATLLLAACNSAEHTASYAGLCRAEMAVPDRTPDTAASVRALEREIADSLSAGERRTLGRATRS